VLSATHNVAGNKYGIFESSQANFQGISRQIPDNIIKIYEIKVVLNTQ